MADSLQDVSFAYSGRPDHHVASSGWRVPCGVVWGLGFRVSGLHRV